MIRHIFCDLDGTLYNNGINEDDVKAIKEIEKEGVIFMWQQVEFLNKLIK